ELARNRRSLTEVLMPVIFTSTLGFAESRGPTDEDVDAERPPQVGGYAISQTPQVWLDHQVAELGGALVFNWDAADGLFPDGLLDEMFGAYCALLGRFAADETSWNAIPLPLLSGRQLETRAAANATVAPTPPGLLHERIMAQAAVRP